MSENASRKRSRFDQTEPIPAKSSRATNRSRSPSSRSKEPRRSRSPVDRSSETPAGDDKPDSKFAASAAAAAAARINAQIQAKKAAGEYNPSTIKTVNAPGSVKSPSTKNDIYQQDGDYIKDIEVNDLRNRYTLTKGSTQKMIKEETGADVTTRGNYYPDKSMATAAAPPLYLHVTSQSKEGLEQAIEKINDMMKQDLPNLIDERRFRRPPPREEFERDEYGRRKWPEEKIPIDLEPIPGFNLRAQVVGQQGTYVKHIQSETGCRVQIKGRGSGFHERDTNMESDEQMYLHVSAPQPDQVQRGKSLCEDLLGNVKERYEEHKARAPSRGPPGGRGGHHYGQDRHNGYNGHRHRESQSYDSYNANPMSPTAAGHQAGAQYEQQPQLQEDQYALMQQYITYYQQNPDEDPYKEFGGYAAYVQNYYQSMTGQQGQQPADQQQQQYGYQYQQGYNPGSPAAGASAYGQAPPPPPPPADDVPPPPPPPPPAGASGSEYHSVPPPPGL